MVVLRLLQGLGTLCLLTGRKLLHPKNKYYHSRRYVAGEEQHQSGDILHRGTAHTGVPTSTAMSWSVRTRS
jgi:hypothetical protein